MSRILYLPWKTYWPFWMVISLTSMCLMTIELVASRLLAPFIGVSIIPWASLIAVVMVAMAIGYRLGGYVADKSHIPMGGLILAAVVPILIMRPSANGLGEYLISSHWSFLGTAFVMSVAIMTLPAMLLAAIYPILMASALKTYTQTGEAAGSINAASAIGSIIGTLATGFIWLMWFSVPVILWSVAAVLLVLGVWTWINKKIFIPQAKAPQELTVRSSERKTLLALYPVVAFGVGFALMSLEVAASRALAPIVGTSAFTWASIIGVILLGMVCGNALGGVLADREEEEGRHDQLGKTIAWSGAAIFVCGCLITLLSPIFGGISLSLAIKSIFFSLIAFFLPACALSMVSPQLIKLVAQAQVEVGGIVGSLSAWNTLGGLIGALSTGFFLIGWMGTRHLFLSLALALMMTGLYMVWPQYPWNKKFSIIIACLFTIQLIVPRGCYLETQYFCIQVLKDDTAKATVPGYILRLDHLVHSYIHLGQPETLGYGYEQVYAHLIATQKTQDQAFSSLFIGGGGYVLPRYLAVAYPSAHSVVAEIDPGVTLTNKRMFGLTDSPAIQTMNMDARMYVSREAPSSTFDFVFADAFNDFSVPYHLTTLEFHTELKSRMSPNGVYALNIIDDARYGQFLSAMLRTLSRVWTHVYVAPGAPVFASGRNTIVLIATDQTLDPAIWGSAISPAARDTGMDPVEYARLTQLISQDKVEAFLKGHPVPPLTDDFAPTDRYLAPVFRDAY